MRVCKTFLPKTMRIKSLCVQAAYAWERRLGVVEGVPPWGRSGGAVEAAAAFDDVGVGLVAFGAVASGVRGLLIF